MTQMQSVDLLINGGTLVTMDRERRIIEKGALAIKDGIIVKLGAAEQVLPFVAPKKIIDAVGRVVTPGFINTHGHWAMTLFRGLVDDQPLESWLSTIWPLEQAFTSPTNVVAGTRLAMMEMIRSGTTCAADMYWQFIHTTEAAREANFRMVNGPSFTEIEGFESQQTSTRDWAIEYLDRYQDDPLIETCVQAHSTYTTSPEMMEMVRKIAEDRKLVFITHASESRSEVQTVREKTGKTPIELLHSYGLLGERTLLAHCVHLRDDEIAMLAETGTSVAHCPSSNLKIASGIARISDMYKAGVNVSIGTDGPASNNDLDMLAEAHIAALLQKGAFYDPTALPAEVVFEMMTINGARALGMGDRIGSLEAGKLADITVMDFDSIHLTPCYNLYSHLIYAVNKTDVRHVIINGVPVMEDRNLLTLDEDRIKAQLNSIGREITQTLGKSN